MCDRFQGAEFFLPPSIREKPQMSIPNRIKDIGHKFQPYACNRCHYLSMMVYDLDDFIITNIKGVDCKCFVCDISQNTGIKLLNNSQLDDKSTL